MQSTKQAIFQLGEEEYGLDIMDVNIIEKYIQIEPVAKFPKNIKGIIRLRGDVIPVYSLRSKFGLEEIEPTDETRFMITTSNDIQIAYEVDKMMEIVDFESEQLYASPEIAQNKDTTYIKAITNVHDRLVILLDQNGILSDEEQEKVKIVMEKEVKKQNQTA